MRLRLPKPLHGWRALVGEVGIIVLGVLIALGASQLVEAWQWRQQVKQAEEVFRNELGAPILNAYAHLTIERCLSDRITAIGTKLIEPRANWQGMPETLNDRGLPWKIGRDPLPIPFHGRPVILQPITTEGWSNALASGTVNHLPYVEGTTVSEAYAAARQLLSDEQKQREAAAKLVPLGTDGALSPDARLAMIQAVADLLRIDGDIANDSETLLVAVKQTRLGYTDKWIQENGATLLAWDRIARGACVAKPNIPQIPSA